MKKKLIASLLIIGSVLTLTGCSNKVSKADMIDEYNALVAANNMPEYVYSGGGTASIAYDNNDYLYMSRDYIYESKGESYVDITTPTETYGKTFDDETNNVLYYTTLDVTKNESSNFENKLNSSGLDWSYAREPYLLNTNDDGTKTLVAAYTDTTGAEHTIEYSYNPDTHKIFHIRDAKRDGVDTNTVSIVTMDVNYDTAIKNPEMLQDIQTRCHANDKKMTLIDVVTNISDTKSICADGMFFLKGTNGDNTEFYADKDCRTPIECAENFAETTSAVVYCK